MLYTRLLKTARPARIIVAGLETMEEGNLACRLPTFELIEWQRTVTAINQLATTQQHLLAERQKLSMKLINVQEEERRYRVSS